MLNPVFLELALEKGLAATNTAVYGRLNGVILALSHMEGSDRQTTITINLLYITEADRLEVKRKLGAAKPKCLVNQRLDSPTGCLLLTIQRPFFGGKRAIKDSLNSILSLIQKVVPPAPMDGEVKLIGGRPLSPDQAIQIRKEAILKKRPLAVRTARAFGMGALGVIISSTLAFSLPRFGRFLASPLAFLFTGFLATAQFLSHAEGDQTEFARESAVFVILEIFIAALQIIGSGFAVIPAGYRHSWEMFCLVLGKGHVSQSFVTVYLFSLGFIISLSLYGLWNQKRGTKAAKHIDLTEATVASARLRLRGMRKVVAFIFASLAFGAIILVLSIISHRMNEQFETSRPILYVSVLAFLTVLLVVSMWLVREPELRELFKSEATGKMNFALLPPIAIMLSIFPLMSLMMSEFLANTFLDHSTPEFRYFKVSSRDSKATLAVCHEVLDAKTGALQPFEACERDVGFLRGGETIRYSYKPGLLQTGLFYAPHLDRSDTWEALIKDLGSFSKVRSVDIAHLMGIPNERKKLSEQLDPTWRKSCAHGLADACRLVAYVAEENRNDASSMEFFGKGCRLGDYISCYAIRLKTPSDRVAIQRHSTLSFKACEAGETEACYQFFYLWKDDGSPSGRHEILNVAKKLCSAGDSSACDRLAWERNRLPLDKP